MSKRLILSMFVAAWLASAAQLTAAEPQKYAVVIGINDYADESIVDLQYAESSARRIYVTLTDPDIGGFARENVKLILGNEATNDNIIGALSDLGRCGKDDLIVVFYNGHGAKSGDEAFWVTQNARSRALAATSLSSYEIRRRLAEIPARQMILMLDCCYSLSAVKQSFTDPNRLFGGLAGGGRFLIATSADSEEAFEYQDKKSSVLTYYLVKGLRGQGDRNADGAITFAELWAYVATNVRKATVVRPGLRGPIIAPGPLPKLVLAHTADARATLKKNIAALGKLYAASRITQAQYDAGKEALSRAALDAEGRSERRVFLDLVEGRLPCEKLTKALAAQKRRVAASAPSESPRLGRWLSRSWARCR